MRGWGQMEIAKTLKIGPQGHFLQTSLCCLCNTKWLLWEDTVYNLLIPPIWCLMDRHCLTGCQCSSLELWGSLALHFEPSRAFPCKQLSQMICSALELLPHCQEHNRLFTLRHWKDLLYIAGRFKVCWNELENELETWLRYDSLIIKAINLTLSIHYF